MKIIDNIGAPPELVRLIDTLGQEVEGIDRVVICAFMPDLQEQRAIGAFEPTTKTIIIDLGHCLTDYRWMEYGALFIANVWLNVVVAVFHEFAHASQLHNGDVTIKEMEQDSEVYDLVEGEAVESAIQEAYNYFSDGHAVPPLKEMGWLGEHIAKTFNNVYSKIPEQIMEEVEAHKSGAVADVVSMTAALPHFSESSIQDLSENIGNGKFGVVVESKQYVTMSEFLDATIG